MGQWWISAGNKNKYFGDLARIGEIIKIIINNINMKHRTFAAEMAANDCNEKNDHNTLPLPSDLSDTSHLSWAFCHSSPTCSTATFKHGAALVEST